MITVRPSARHSTARITSTSASTSRLAVGSSRMSTGASRRMARAIAMRCRCPLEKFLPPSCTTVSYPPGSRLIVSCTQACRAAVSICSWLAPGLPSSRLSRTVPSNSTESCRTIAMLPRRTSSGYSRVSSPSMVTAPCQGSCSRGSSLTIVDLPPPDRPTNASRLPARTVRSTPRSTGRSPWRYPNTTPRKATSPWSLTGEERPCSPGRCSQGCSRISRTRPTAAEAVDTSSISLARSRMGW